MGPSYPVAGFTPEYAASDDESVVTQPISGDRLGFYWPIDNAFYHGVVTSISDGGQHVIPYDDGDLETLDLASEAWRLCTATVSSIRIARSLASDEPAVLANMLTHFDNRPFILHHTQGFPPYATANAYDD